MNPQPIYQFDLDALTDTSLAEAFDLLASANLPCATMVARVADGVPAGALVLLRGERVADYLNAMRAVDESAGS